MSGIFFGWSRWSPHVSNAITIAAAVPPITAALAAFWAYLSPLSGLEIAFVALATFTMALWSCIGLLWLLDRSRPATPIQTSQIRDCSWGLNIGDIILGYDPESPEQGWQFKFPLINSLSWPIRVIVEDLLIRIEGMTPSEELQFPSVGLLIPAQSSIMWNMQGFPLSKFNHQPRMTGNISLTIKYGHPSDGYSRTTKRKYYFECLIRGELPPTPFGYITFRRPLEETDNPVLQDAQ